jgi:glutathione-specific gamma-glutamylcyclotransferase
MNASPLVADVVQGPGVGRDAGWVFGYGSLMWRPGFPVEAAVRARLEGWERSFCIYSVHHRGTPERPGLVLGLAEGAGVGGVALRPPADRWAEVYAYLLEREQPTETYVEALATVRLQTGQTGQAVRALVFLSDRAHPQWAGRLPLERQAELIAGARGLSGRNVDYLRDLVDHLQAAGERDVTLESLLARVERRELAALQPLASETS